MNIFFNFGCLGVSLATQVSPRVYISTEKSLEQKKENKKGRILRQERYSGVMQRTFYVGESVTEEDIKAKYENGVLSLMIPKKEAPKVPEKKQILIEG